MAKTGTLAVVGSETLLGREIRDLVSTTEPSLELKLIAADDEEPGRLTEQSGEPVVLSGLDEDALENARIVFLTGSPESSRKALELSSHLPSADFRIIDLTYAAEENPRARLRAPIVEPDDFRVPADALHVIAHPAAVAISMLLERVHTAFAIRRSVVHIFEPASERGAGGLEELQQQTVNLLSFKSVPKRIFDAQLSFNLLARYGEDAPFTLEQIEQRIERHAATLLALQSAAPPMPSLKLLQAPVFHGYSFSIWVEVDGSATSVDLEEAIEGDGISVHQAEFDPPNPVGVAGESGISVGAVAPDRNVAQAFWLWMAVDNIRMAAENALQVARQLV